MANVVSNVVVNATATSMVWAMAFNGVMAARSVIGCSQCYRLPLSVPGRARGWPRVAPAPVPLTSVCPSVTAAAALLYRCTAARALSKQRLGLLRAAAKTLGTGPPAIVGSDTPYQRWWEGSRTNGARLILPPHARPMPPVTSKCKRRGVKAIAALRRSSTRRSYWRNKITLVDCCRIAAPVKSTPLCRHPQ